MPDDSPTASALEDANMTKWAGEPSASSGLAGTSTDPADLNYDAQKKPTPFTEVGATGLAQYGGFIREEFLIQLSGDAALKTWREMYDNDAIVGAFMYAVTMICRQVEWRVEPPEAATVDDIVEERIAERQAKIQEAQQAQQQKLAMTQAGLAANSTNPRGAGPGGKPAPTQPPGMGRAGLAGAAGGAPGLHEPIGGHPTAGATPPGSPGPNPRTQATLPGTNAPGESNTPGTNPGGGPAQAAALGGLTGLPGAGSPKKKLSNPNDPPFAASRDTDPPGWVRNVLTRLRKAGSGGGMVGGIDEGSADANAVDPETDEPLIYPTGAGPEDITPEARKALELAVLVETALHDMSNSWAETVAEVFTMIPFGFAFHEIVYKKRNGPNPDYPEQGSKFSDGRIGWAKWAGRAQETRFRWEFGDHGEVLGMWQLAPPKFQLRYLPLSKALLFRTTGYKGNPEGKSSLRSAYRSWYYLKRIQETEAIGVERDLAGLPVFKVPAKMMSANATPEEKAVLAAIKKLVRNIRRNEQEGVVLPMEYDDDGNEMYTFELLASPSRRQFDTNQIITRYESRMAMTLLADFILMGHDAVGARSLGETKTDMFTTALEAFLDIVADVANTFAVPRLMQLNGEDPAMSPIISHGKLETVTLEQIAAIITALSGAGDDLFPDTSLSDWVRDKFGAPPKAASPDL